jgi:hypothetical protein
MFKLLFSERSEIPIFSFQGTDYNGKKYSCNHLYTSQPILNVTEFKLSGKIQAEHYMSYYSKIIFSGEYRLPMDKVSNSRTNFGEKLSYTDYKEIWEVKLEDGLSVLFSKFNGYTEAILIGEPTDAVDDDLLERVISTFDFIMGKETEPVLVNIGTKSHYMYGKRNMLLADSTFQSPLPMTHDRGDEFTINHSNLFRSYFNYIATTEGAILPTIHKRIVSSSRGYIFAMGLVVSIQIENICKQFYSDKYVKDEEYCNQLLEAIEVLSISDKVKFNGVIMRLKSSIPSNNRKSINVKNILINLRNEDMFDNELVKAWVKMRNKTAHGENVSGGGWSKFLDEAFLCINLYYILIFNIIGYKGYKRYFENCHNNRLIPLP